MTDALCPRPVRRRPSHAGTGSAKGRGKRASGARRDLAGLKLLLLDNTDSHARALRQSARMLGIRSVAALTQPEDALLAVAADVPPDTVLVNWNGELNDPVAFCRRIRDPQGFRRPFAPIIMLAHSATRDVVLTAREAGVDEFLAVPFSPKALRERLLAILNNRRGFVQVPSYFGPCRRRGAMADWLGADRRTAPGPLIDPDSGMVYIG